MFHIASPAGVFRGDRISSPPFVGREEIRSPLKTPTGEAMFHTEKSCMVRDMHINFLWLLFILVGKICPSVF